MANLPSSIKRVRQEQKRRLRNRAVKSRVSTAIKRARIAIEQQSPEEAEEAVRNAVSAIDRAAQKGVIHSNNAARKKSRLMQLLNGQKEQAST